MVYYVRLAKEAITVYRIRADGEVSVISRLINYTWELNVAQACLPWLVVLLVRRYNIRAHRYKCVAILPV